LNVSIDLSNLLGVGADLRERDRIGRIIGKIVSVFDFLGLLGLSDELTNQPKSHVLVLGKIEAILLGALNNHLIIIEGFLRDVKFLSSLGESHSLDLASLGVFSAGVELPPSLDKVQDLKDLSLLVSSPSGGTN
jgi:hypothetical protein